MIDEIRRDLNPYKATLVAVSKTKPNELIMTLYNQGQRIFGENRVQELTYKYEDLPKDIEWHLIGSLQKNKVKYIAPFISMIHSVDSIKLAQVIDTQAQKNDRSIDVLLQVKIAQEETKAGLDKENCMSILERCRDLDHITVRGLMGMASFTEDIQQVRAEFDSLKTLFDRCQCDVMSDSNYFNQISMGMSGDYKIALEAGSTMVRIGSLLFGAR